jgi:hypothetical protein
MPESILHNEAVELLKAILAAWAARHEALVVRNLAVRWDREHPSFGVDPDVAVFMPPPPDAEDLRSLRTWTDGHAAPCIAVEVVSETTPHKDYIIAPDKYAASGTRELWMFDPLLAGPTSHGGPFRLQVWTRDTDGTLTRVYAGDGPVYSAALEAYLVVVAEGRRLRIASDAECTHFWPTNAEAERAAKEIERTAKEAALAAKDNERAAKEAALARVAELEAALARLGRQT